MMKAQKQEEPEGESFTRNMQHQNLLTQQQPSHSIDRYSSQPPSSTAAIDKNEAILHVTRIVPYHHNNFHQQQLQQQQQQQQQQQPLFSQTFQFVVGSPNSQTSPTAPIVQQQFKPTLLSKKQAKNTLEPFTKHIQLLQGHSDKAIPVASPLQPQQPLLIEDDPMNSSIVFKHAYQQQNNQVQIVRDPSQSSTPIAPSSQSSQKNNSNNNNNTQGNQNQGKGVGINANSALSLVKPISISTEDQSLRAYYGQSFKVMSPNVIASQMILTQSGQQQQQQQQPLTTNGITPTASATLFSSKNKRSMNLIEAQQHDEPDHLADYSQTITNTFVLPTNDYDRSPLQRNQGLTSETRLPPIQKSSQNQSNFKLKKLRVNDKDLKKNLEAFTRLEVVVPQNIIMQNALLSIANIKNNNNNNNNTTTTNSKTVQNTNQHQKFTVTNTQNMQSALLLNQIDLEVKKIIPSDQSQAKFKRTQARQPLLQQQIQISSMASTTSAANNQFATRHTQNEIDSLENKSALQHRTSQDALDSNINYGDTTLSSMTRMNLNRTAQHNFGQNHNNNNNTNSSNSSILYFDKSSTKSTARSKLLDKLIFEEKTGEEITGNSSSSSSNNAINTSAITGWATSSTKQIINTGAPLNNPHQFEHVSNNQPTGMLSATPMTLLKPIAKQSHQSDSLRISKRKLLGPTEFESPSESTSFNSSLKKAPASSTTTNHQNQPLQPLLKQHAKLNLNTNPSLTTLRKPKTFTKETIDDPLKTDTLTKHSEGPLATTLSETNTSILPTKAINRSISSTNSNATTNNIFRKNNEAEDDDAERQKQNRKPQWQKITPIKSNQQQQQQMPSSASNIDSNPQQSEQPNIESKNQKSSSNGMISSAEIHKKKLMNQQQQQQLQHTQQQSQGGNSNTSSTAPAAQQQFNQAANLQVQLNSQRKKKKKKNPANPNNANGSSTGNSNSNATANANTPFTAQNDANLPKEVQRTNQYAEFLRIVNFSNHIDVPIPSYTSSSSAAAPVQTTALGATITTGTSTTATTITAATATAATGNAGVKPLFKMYVGIGNNSSLIQASIKQRWWLQLVTNKEQIDQCHIVWTQLRMNELIAVLKPYSGVNPGMLNEYNNNNVITPSGSSSLSENKISTSKSIAQNNDSFYADSLNDTSTNCENSPSRMSSQTQLNGSETPINGGNSNSATTNSQYSHNNNNSNNIELSDSESEKHRRSLSNRPSMKKSNSHNSLNVLTPSITTAKKLQSTSTPSSANPFSSQTSKDQRSLTPSIRGQVQAMNVLKVPPMSLYNMSVKRLFHVQDFKKLIDIHASTQSKDSTTDLRTFFASPLTEIFATAKRQFEQTDDAISIRMHNHLENNWNLSNKKALFYNLRNYYTTIKQNPFDNIPLTFHIKDGTNDPEYSRFLEHFRLKADECAAKEKFRLECKFSADKQKQALAAQMKKPRNIWIVKPGEITNRGTGITVLSEIDQITQLLDKNELHPNGKPKTFIVQKYLDNPLLYSKRKFDIRCYVLVTSVKGRMKAYWYQDGYIRTSCKEYSCKNLNNKMVHLTNDAVQNKCEDYGKYEPGNKLSYSDLQRYLDQNHTEQKINFMNVVYPRMKQLALDCVKSTFLKMDPQRKEMTFEVFGLDYMIDDEFRTWLIEVNTNPCLELSSPLLARIIPAMIESTFRIAIDPIFGFPPFAEWPANAKKTFIPDQILENCKFELIFDQAFDGPQLQALFSQYNEQQRKLIHFIVQCPPFID